ncbi:ubiquitin regulatory protein [Theileria orientalis]|uniref:Ubiquitin regulatory protein n=1 Tax=Theileria orientalis TaxID=68886 RepID=A0A976M3J9_THEOR|nr:ubiquitin regulatory protein [Theileria orientalis]
MIFCHNIFNFVNLVFKAIFELFQVSLRRFWSFMSISPSNLLDQYENKYGSIHPKIFMGSFEEAKKLSLQTNKLVVLYIHSENYDKICKEMFTNQLIMELIDSNFILFIELIKGPRMRKLMELTNTLLLPHISVIAFQNMNRYTMVNRLDGNFDQDALISMLLSSVDYKPVDPVESSRRVIEEQNEEYRRAVEIDSIKFKEKEIKRQDEVRRRKTLETKQSQKREKKQKILNDRKEMANKYKMVNRTGDVKIKVKLPNGNSIETLFNRDDTVQKIYEWVEISDFLGEENESAAPTSSNPENKYKIPYNFNLYIPHPSKLLSDKELTLGEANLAPSSLLMLASLDDTSEEEL